jgi:TRAP-type C4-dicarboxylate transport system substrate-binding protein
MEFYMTTRSRIAAFLSVSALCLGVVAAPAASAADTTTATPAKHAKAHPKHKAAKPVAQPKADTPAK